MSVVVAAVETPRRACTRSCHAVRLGRLYRPWMSRVRWDAGRGCPGSVGPLRLLPQRVHLRERGLGRRLALGGEAFLDLGEALAELAVGAGEGGLGVDGQLARQ